MRSTTALAVTAVGVTIVAIVVAIVVVATATATTRGSTRGSAGRAAVEVAAVIVVVGAVGEVLIYGEGASPTVATVTGAVATSGLGGSAEGVVA